MLVRVNEIDMPRPKGSGNPALVKYQFKPEEGDEPKTAQVFVRVTQEIKDKLMLMDSKDRANFLRAAIAAALENQINN